MNMPISRTQSRALSNAPPTGPCLKSGSSARDKTDLKGGMSFFKFKGNAATSSWIASPQASRKVARRRNLWHLLLLWRRRNKSRRSSLGNSLLKNSSRDVKSPSPSVEGVAVIVTRSKKMLKRFKEKVVCKTTAQIEIYLPLKKYTQYLSSPYTATITKDAESVSIVIGVPSPARSVITRPGNRREPEHPKGSAQKITTP